jgi:hypothetical protein
MPARVLPFPARPTQTTTKPKKKSAKKRVAKKKGKAKPVKASDSVTGEKSRLACGCVGTKSFAEEEKPVFWINLGCRDGGADHQPGARRILEPDDEVEV